MARIRPEVQRFAEKLSRKLDEMDPERKYANREMTEKEIADLIVGGLGELEHIEDIRNAEVGIDAAVSTAAYMVLMADALDFNNQLDPNKLLVDPV